MNLTDRLITEIVEKCDGLSITAEQASNILAYLQYGAPMTATTSKLGAEMLTDEQIGDAIERVIGFRDLKNGEKSLRKELASLLARQPAAIDKEAILTVDMVRDAVFDAGFALPQWDRIRFQLNSALRKARATSAPSVEQDERVRQFEALCDLLPSDVSWGDHLTPDIALHIARAASTSANVAQGAEAVAWLVTSKRGLVRVAWTDKPTAEQVAVAEYDGDTITPLYAAPPAQTALTEVGFVVHDELHGWHFAPTVAWTYLGKGRALYALTAAQSASGADHAN